MADAAKPEEPAQPEPSAEVAPRMEDVLYPLRVGPSGSRPLRAERPLARWRARTFALKVGPVVDPYCIVVSRRRYPSEPASVVVGV